MTTDSSETYLAKRRSAKRHGTVNHPEPPKIERGVPLPVEARGGTRPRRYDHLYPFEDMRVGDSFWVPAGEWNCTSGAMTKFARRTGYKFISRGQARDGRANSGVGQGERGTRVWRMT